MTDHYELCYVLADLAVLHYLKQKMFVSQKNSLIGSYSDLFGKRVKNHLDKSIETGRKMKVGNNLDDVIRMEHFEQLSSILQNQIPESF